MGNLYNTMKDLDKINAAEMGHLLEGFGINLLATRVDQTVAFLHEVLGFEIRRQSGDYAVLAHRDQLYQLHADSTYSTHPLAALLPEAGLRGVGVELRVYQVDPDQAESRAREKGYEVLQATTDKPHGLRECFLLDPDGYCWVPSVKS